MTEPIRLFPEPVELAAATSPGEVAFTVYGLAAPAGSKTAGRTRDGRSFVRDSSKRSYPWKTQVYEAAATAMAGRPLYTGPLAVSLTFYAPRPKGHYGTRGVRPSAPAFPTTRPDVLKLARAVEDACTSIVWRDDSQIVTETLAKRFGEPARVEVSVQPVIGSV